MFRKFMTMLELAIADKLEALRQQDVAFVGIDGQSGAGKSTLASAVVGKFGGQVVPMDDFYRPLSDTERLSLSPKEGYALYFDFGRLAEEILEPLRHGKAVSYSPYDWQTGKMSVKEKRILPQGLIVVEGVYALRPELNNYYDLKLFVTVPDNIRHQRLVKRSDPPKLAQKWEAAEKWYLENILQLGENADIMVLRG